MVSKSAAIFILVIIIQVFHQSLSDDSTENFVECLLDPQKTLLNATNEKSDYEKDYENQMAGVENEFRLSFAIFNSEVRRNKEACRVFELKKDLKHYLEIAYLSCGGVMNFENPGVDLSSLEEHLPENEEEKVVYCQNLLITADIYRTRRWVNQAAVGNCDYRKKLLETYIQPWLLCLHDYSR